MPNEQKEEQQGPVFFIPQKVDAFIESYEPAKDDRDADEIYTDARLRQYFQAYPRPTGDPLVDYVETLSHHGFKFKTIVTGEPAICVKYRM